MVFRSIHAVIKNLHPFMFGAGLYCPK